MPFFLQSMSTSKHEQDAARGGYYPRLDLTTDIGREKLQQPDSPTTSLNRRGAALTLNQMIYDGFATRDEVARLAYAKLVRYYEVLDASESTALEEAARAYLDVLRYRELFTLTQDNLAQHDQVFKQIQERVEAGVGRRVDLEQAGGRLALAQSNMLTETSNLHDVSARFLRIVGELPPDEMLAPELLKQGIPSSIEETLKLGYQDSPAFNAAIENVRAAQADARGRQANFQPRVDLRASQDVAYNDSGLAGRSDNQVIELVLNYNLFKGGADRAQLANTPNGWRSRRSCATRPAATSARTCPSRSTTFTTCRASWAFWISISCRSKKPVSPIASNSTSDSAPCSTCWIPKTSTSRHGALM